MALGEQRRIAEILDAIDEAIRSTERQVTKEMTLTNALLSELIPHERLHARRGRNRPATGSGNSGSMDFEGPLDEVAVRGSGHTPRKGTPSFWNGGVRWVSLADSDKLDQIFISQTAKEVSRLGIENSSAVLHPAGTVILSRDASVGRSAVLATPMAVSQHFMAWQCGNALSDLYLYFWLQRHKRDFENIAIGSTIKTIGLAYFRGLRISLPSREAQDVVVEQLLAAEQQAESSRAQLMKLRQLRNGLADDLLSGRVRTVAS